MLLFSTLASYHDHSRSFKKSWCPGCTPCSYQDPGWRGGDLMMFQMIPYGIWRWFHGIWKTRDLLQLSQAVKWLTQFATGLGPGGSLPCYPMQTAGYMGPMCATPMQTTKPGLLPVTRRAYEMQLLVTRSGVELSMCLSDTCAGDAAAADLGTTLQEPLCRLLQNSPFHKGTCLAPTW